MDVNTYKLRETTGVVVWGEFHYEIGKSPSRCARAALTSVTSSSWENLTNTHPALYANCIFISVPYCFT